jgi:hypothetical protein
MYGKDGWNTVDFDEFWTDLMKKAPWLRERGIDYAIMEIAWAAWKDGYGLGYDTPHID